MNFCLATDIDCWCTDTGNSHGRLHHRLLSNFSAATRVRFQHNSNNEQGSIMDSKSCGVRCAKGKLFPRLSLILIYFQRHGTRLLNWWFYNAKIWPKICTLLSLHSDDSRMVSNFVRQQHSTPVSRAVSDR